MSGPRAHAVAITSSATWIDGTGYRSVLHPLDDATMTQLIARAEIAAGKTLSSSDGLVLILDHSALNALGLNDRPDPAASQAWESAGGETRRNAGKAAHWSTFFAHARPAVYVCVPAWSAPDADNYLIDADNPAGSTMRLATYAKTVGSPFYMSPPVAALVHLRTRPRHSSVLWKPDLHSAARRAIDAADRPVVWKGQAGGRYRHRYDARAAFLNGAIQAQVATGNLERGHRWNPARGGVWLMQTPAWNHDRMPAPWAGQQVDSKGRVWLTTGVVRLMLELAEAGWCDTAAVLDSWTGDGSRALRTWGESIRDALAALDVPDDPEALRVRQTVKALYQRGYGMLAAHTAGSVARPDWSRAIAGQAWVSLWRKMWAVGQAENRWPAAINTDCVTYISNQADPVAACPRGLTLGDHLGQFKVEGPVLVDA